jgi:tungstate transport system ATP-binding protein
VLEGRDLQMTYGAQTVLDVPRVEVQEREVLALIGPNGAGKSTLLRLLGLLERSSRGTVAFRGSPVRWNTRDLLAIRRRFACVFQEPLLCDATVEDNVALGLRLRGERGAGAAGKVRVWLDRLGIGHLAGRRARTLSGGEAQRTSLARAFVLQPEVLLLDEPFAALDPPTRSGLLDLLQQLLRQESCTTVFVTHDREDALRLGDRVAVVMDGRMHQAGTPAEVFGRPVSEDVARFVGMETILEGRVLGGRDGLLRVGVHGATLEVPGKATAGGRVYVCLRPEDLVIRPSQEAVRESARNHLPGVVRDATRLEAQYRVRIDCGVEVVALVTKQSFEDLALAPSTPVTVTFKASAVHLIQR